MNKLLIIGCLLLVGCATVVDRDFEKEEADFIKQYGEAAKKDPFYAPSTPNDVMAAHSSGIRVVVHKSKSIRADKLELQRWSVILTNETDKAQCVSVFWKLMDFELINDRAESLLVQPKQQLLNYATLIQKIWNIDGTRFALPPSGYIERLEVHPPNPLSRKGDECLIEDNIIDK